MTPTIGQLCEALDNYKSVFKECSSITGNDQKFAFIMDSHMEYGLCYYFEVVEDIECDYTSVFLTTNGFSPNRAGYIGSTPTVLHRFGKNPAIGLRSRIRTLEELIKNNE